MLLYIMLYIVLAYLMLFAALTNSVCLNNTSLLFFRSFFRFYIFYYRSMSSPEKYHLKITIIIIIIIYQHALRTFILRVHPVAVTGSPNLLCCIL